MLTEQLAHGTLVDGQQVMLSKDHYSIESQDKLGLKYAIQVKHSSTLKLPTLLVSYVHNGLL